MEEKLVASSIPDFDFINNYLSNVPVSSINRDVEYTKLLELCVCSRGEKDASSDISNTVGDDGISMVILELVFHSVKIRYIEQ